MYYVNIYIYVLCIYILCISPATWHFSGGKHVTWHQIREHKSFSLKDVARNRKSFHGKVSFFFLWLVNDGESCTIASLVSTQVIFSGYPKSTLQKFFLEEPATPG